MNGNYEWNKQMTQQQLQKRYAEAELSRQLKQEGQQRHGQFSITSVFSAVWQKLRSRGWADADRPVQASGRQQAQQGQT